MSRATPFLTRARAFSTSGSSSAASAHNLVFLGAPGVGKGTFASRVSKKLGIPAISTGDIIRAEIKADSAMGRRLKEITNSGQLVPDEVVTAMVKERLRQPDAQAGYILDGYPRTTQQAVDLDGFQVVSRVVNITLPEHVLTAKMLARRVCGDCGRGYNLADIKEGELDMPPLLPKPADCAVCVGKPRLVQREDDTASVVAERMKVYHAQTAPLIAYYAAQRKLQDFAVKKGIDDTPRMFVELGMPA